MEASARWRGLRIVNHDKGHSLPKITIPNEDTSEFEVVWNGLKYCDGKWQSNTDEEPELTEKYQRYMRNAF